MLRRLKYILLMTLFLAIQVVVQAQYVIDKVCKDAVRTYRVDQGNGEPVLSYKWILNDASGNTLSISAGSPSGAGSETEIKWSFNPGIYTLSVEKQSIYNCVVVELGTIEVIPVPIVDAGTDQTVCVETGTVVSLGDAKATDVTPNGIEWTTSGGGSFSDSKAVNPIYTPGPGDLLAGKVTLKISAKSMSDEDGCVQEDEIEILLSPKPLLVITNPQAVCEPDWVDLTAASVTDGSTIPAGVVPTYWTDAAATIALANPGNVTVSGTYYIKLGTNVSCHDIKPVKVTVNKQPKLVITPPSAVCEPATVDIGAAYIISGSDPGLTFSYWTDAAATSPLSNYTAISSGGTYFIKADNGTKCPSIQPVTVTILQKSTPQFSLNNVLCLNSLPPVLPTTSTDGFKGTWSPAVVSTSSLGTTSYLFTPDPGECALPFKLDITITDEIKPVFAAIGPFCVGDSPTVLPLTSTNGIAGKWSPATISTATAGTTFYTFTPDDATQCFTSFNLPVTINTPGTLTFDPIAPICQNSANPLPPKSIEGISGKWSPAFSSATVGLTTYTFTPDAGQCAISSTLDITVVPSVPVIFDPIGPFCTGDPAPALLPTSKEGISGTWSPATVDMTQSGTYNFTADGGLCASYALPVVIYRLNLTETHVDLGYNTSPIGSIDLTVSGGSGSYSYSWSGPNGFTSTIEDINGLAAGDYRIKVNDLITNCEEELPVTLTQSILTVSFTSTPVTCFGGTDGSATANPSGGMPPYKYLWDNGQTTQTISGLSSGTYYVTVTDAKGIGSTGSVYIIQPLELFVTATQIGAPDCSETAQVLVAATGGTSGYNGVGTFLATAGPHTFTVTDANNCTQSKTVNVILYDHPQAPTTNLIQPNCFDPTGTIEVTSPIPVAGSSYTVTGPSPVNITTQNTTGVFSGLVPGIYSVSAINSNSCPSVPISVTINVPPVIPASPTAILLSPVCETSPIQTLNANKGIIPPPPGTTIVWYDAPTGGNAIANPTLNTTSTVTYYASATNGECTSIGRTPVTLTIIPRPAGPISKGNLSACESSPLVILDARDAIDAAGKNLVWYDALVGGNVVATPTLNAIKIVTYYVEDVNGICASSPRTPVTLTIYPLPAKATAIVSVVPRCIDSSGEIEVKSPLGANYMYSIDNGVYQSSVTFINQTPGNHSIRVKNTITTCESGVTVIKVPDIPPVPKIIGLTVEDCLCFGDQGKLNFKFENITDGTYVIIYLGGQFENVKVEDNKATVLAPAGTYNVLAIEANGCTSSENWNVEIKQPDQISVSATITEIDLKSKQKGEINLTITGGTGPYQTIWQPNPFNGFTGAATEDIKNLDAGLYVVSITDANGCPITFSETIPKANLPPIATNDEFEAGCGGVSGDLLYADNGSGIDSDPDGDLITVVTTPIRNPLHGVLTIHPDGTFEYMAVQGYTGDDTFLYTIFDVKKNYSIPAIVTIHVVSDFDCDGFADLVDDDADGDGILNVDEGGTVVDTDGDGHPNWLDIDDDNDGIVDNIEAQLYLTGYIPPSGKHTDNDGLDDNYDTDQSGANLKPIDSDVDGIPDFLDPDSDNDGVPDYIEGHDGADADGKPAYLISGKDFDDDGLDDVYDTINRFASPYENMTGSNSPLQDFDGDGLNDWRDENDDDDEYLTRFEDLNMDGDFSNDDTDRDGHPEYLDYGRDCDLFIPNAFSPNDDNIHDYFQIYCIDHFPNARMYIFDQLGNKLYEQNNYGNVVAWGAPERAWWDGRTTNRAATTTSGGKVAPGTYYYVLQLGNGEVKKSFVFVSY